MDKQDLVYTSGLLSLVNYSNFEDPMVDELIETGAGIVDAEQRLEHHKGVQKRIQEQSAFGWTVEPYFRIGLSSNLKGWRWYTAQYYKLHEMEFVEPLMHMAPVARVCHQMLRLRLGRGNG